MQRFILSSSKIKGKAEVLYDTNGRLVRLDLSAVELSNEQIQWLKHRVSILAEDIYNCFQGSGMVVTEEEFVVTFEDFWNAYPYKRNRHLAEAYWPKMSNSDHYLAFVGAIEYKKFIDRKNATKQWLNAKIPAAWLKDKEYKNNWKTL
jgi:hypothetical protein